MGRKLRMILVVIEATSDTSNKYPNIIDILGGGTCKWHM
jgi:hypothetical protein